MKEAPKILFVVGIHDAENEVTRDVATALVFKFLKLGYDAQLIETPKEYTLYEQARKAIETKSSFDPYWVDGVAEDFLKKLSLENRGAAVVDVHARGVEDRDKIKPRRMTVRKDTRKYALGTPYNFNLRELAFSQQKRGQLFRLEVPATAVPSNKESKALAQALYSTSSYQQVSYFTMKADGRKTRATNMINPRNIARIAHLIHTEIQTAKGNFHVPRKPMYMTRTKRLGPRPRTLRR